MLAIKAIQDCRLFQRSKTVCQTSLQEEKRHSDFKRHCIVPCFLLKNNFQEDGEPPQRNIN